MCRRCAEKVVNSLVAKHRDYGVSRINPIYGLRLQFNVCVFAHNDHSHLRFSRSHQELNTPEYTEWYHVPSPIDGLLSVLTEQSGRFSVHRHEDASDEQPHVDAEVRSILISNQPQLRQLIALRHGSHAHDCAICLESTVGAKDNELVVLPCGHVFHQSCIDNWFNRSQKCPTCRKEITQTAIAEAISLLDAREAHKVYPQLGQCACMQDHDQGVTTDGRETTPHLPGLSPRINESNAVASTPVFELSYGGRDAGTTRLGLRPDSPTLGSTRLEVRRSFDYLPRQASLDSTKDDSEHDLEDGINDLNAGASRLDSPRGGRRSKFAKRLRDAKNFVRRFYPLRAATQSSIA